MTTITTDGEQHENATVNIDDEYENTDTGVENNGPEYAEIGMKKQRTGICIMHTLKLTSGRKTHSTMRWHLNMLYLTLLRKIWIGSSCQT